MSNFFQFHVHTNHSSIDGMSDPTALVEKAARMGQPAIGFLDHGNLSATVKGYKAAQRLGLKFFPGFEGYLIDPARDDWETPAKNSPVKRYHFGIQALTLRGYQGLVQLSSLSHTRPRFNRFPRLTLGDLATFGMEYGEDVALYTGCFFGYVQQTMVNDKDFVRGIANAERIILQYKQWFPHLFVELQHHNIDHFDDQGGFQYTDDMIVDALYGIAKRNELPVIAGQDSHYKDQNETEAHNLMKRMVYAGSDDSFPGDSFHLASAEWVQEHYTDEQWQAVEKGHAHLLDLHDLTIPPLDDFKADIPKIHKAPKKFVRQTCEDALVKHLNDPANRIPKTRYDDYWGELERELRIINKIGMAAYFVVVRDYVEWCHANDIFVEARGSANGSLVCFLLGITQIDPIKWGTDFDRFLSEDRIHPPDIDMDVEDSRRPELVHYLLSKYDSVQIGTFSQLGATYDEREDREGGSLLQTWLTYKRRACFDEAKEILTQKAEKRGTKAPTQVDIKSYGSAMFARKYGNVEDVRDVGEVEPKDYPGLRKMIAMNSVYRSYGVHAGGILLSGQNIRIEDYIPTMLVASSDTRVSQYDMDDVEEFGLLKMDILGQATLRTMKIANELIGETDDPTDFSWIRDNDNEALKALRSGRTKTGIFHQEGYTKAKGGRSLPIRSTKDCVLWQALYMPGAMDTGQTAHVEKARRDRDFRDSVTYIHPIFEKHLKDTYGAYVYQNQVMSILRDMGMDIPSINKFLKVVKASGKGATEKNRVILEGLAETYHDLCVQNGIDAHDEEESWKALCGFGAYGFNKNHAAGYGVRSYRCAYLKANYPLEYMTALLATWAGRVKEPDYTKEARRVGIRLLSPNVNISTDTWTIDRKRKGIRRGLSSIKGVGDKSALAIAEAAPFSSIEDMVKRVTGRALTGGKDYLATEGDTRKGVMAALADSGALEDLPMKDQGTLYDPDDEVIPF
jgi:DNA polymerase III subunit alpha